MLQQQKPFYKKTWFLVIMGLIMLSIILPVLQRRPYNTQNIQNVQQVKKETKNPEQILKDAENRIKEYKKLLKNYYPNKEDLGTLLKDKIDLLSIINHPEFSKKATQLLNENEILSREVFAKDFERNMLKSGYNYKVSALGKNKDILRIEWVLMTSALVYKVRNETPFENNAKLLGFKKVIYTDGFNRSWTVDLTKE